MKKSEQYRLWFSKQVLEGWIRYGCNPSIQSNTTNESRQLSNLLDLISDKEAEGLLEEINNAINGEYFDEYFSFDVSSGSDSVQIIPPNALINYSHIIALVDLKALLEEWIEFCKA